LFVFWVDSVQSKKKKEEDEEWRRGGRLGVDHAIAWAIRIA